MTTPKIVVTNPVSADVLARLKAVGDVTMNAGSEPWSPDELKQQLFPATAMMGFMTDSVDAHVLEHAPELEVVACALKGFDSYDVAACTARGVWVTIVPDLLTGPTAELAVGLAIGLARHVRQADAYVRSGAFKGWRPTFYGAGLAGSTVAIVGLGQVGRAIAARLTGFECRLIGVDPAAPTIAGVERRDLGAALPAADIVILAAPLTAGTQHMISRQALGQAKRGSLWVNVGRGSVVDEDAIADALERGETGSKLHAGSQSRPDRRRWPAREAIPLAVRTMKSITDI